MTTKLSKDTNTQISFYWVPAHIGIPENEIVDKAAKRGAAMKWVGTEITMPILSAMIKEKQQEKWTTPAENFKNVSHPLYKISKPIMSTLEGSRKEIVYLKQLRSGGQSMLLGKYRNTIGLQNNKKMHIL